MHSSLLRVCVCVCVRACMYVTVRTEKDAIHMCVPMSLSSIMTNMIGKRVLDHVFRARVPKYIYGADLLCICLLKASGRLV